MLAHDYLKNLKEQYHQLFKRYREEDSKIIEPVVSYAYSGDERLLVFCHPEDSKYCNFLDFKHAYFIL